MTEERGMPFSDHKMSHLAIIHYPHFDKLHEDISECQKMSKIAGEPQCMSLTGPSGAGKSTLVRTYANAFPRNNKKNRVLIPVLYVETPSPVTVKGMCAAMLDQLGDPTAFKGTLYSMNHRLVGFLNDCDVELVILDEFHHLIDSETNRILEKVSEWLKSIIKKTGKPFLVVGIDGKVESILRTNPQLSRLFPIREQVRPLTYEPVRENEFVQFIIRAEQAIELPLTEELLRAELLYRLHYVSDGIVGHVMNLLRYAAMLARDHGHSVIELNDLCQAFDRRIANVLIEKVNPFKEMTGEEFEPPAPSTIDALSGLSVGNRDAALRRNSVSEVLRAR